MYSHRENRRIVVPALAGATCRTEDNTVVLFSSSFVHFPFLTTYWLIYYCKNVSYFYIRQTARLLYEEIPLNNQIGQSIHIKWGGGGNSALTNQRDPKEPDPIPTPDKGRTEHGFLRRTGLTKVHMVLPGLRKSISSPTSHSGILPLPTTSALPTEYVNRNSPWWIKDPQLPRSSGNKQTEVLQVVLFCQLDTSYCHLKWGNHNWGTPRHILLMEDSLWEGLVHRG